MAHFDADTVTAGRNEGRVTSTTDPTQAAFTKYFGQPNKPVYVQPYAKQEYETYDLPDAWEGKNLFLRDTIDGFILDGNDWFTSKALPYLSHDGRSISWNKFTFNQTLAGVVPEEGVSRRITSSNESRTESTIRHGLSFVLEHGFMNTPEGKQQYLRNIQHIAQCVQETNNHDVLSALLARGQHGRTWRDRHGSDDPYFNWKALAKRQVGEWAVVQKSNDGMSVLHEEYKKRLHRSHCTPDMWIFPSKMMLYTSMDPGSIDYKENMHVGPGVMSNFRGVPVYEAREFEVDDLHIDLLRQRQQIGEYYHMKNPHTVGGDYMSHHMDVKVYDEDTDDWGKYTINQALDSCERFDAQGNLQWPDEFFKKPDLFTYKDGAEQRKCEYWGDVEAEYMPAEFWRVFAHKSTERTGKRGRSASPIRSSSGASGGGRGASTATDTAGAPSAVEGATRGRKATIPVKGKPVKASAGPPRVAGEEAKTDGEEGKTGGDYQKHMSTVDEACGDDTDAKARCIKFLEKPITKKSLSNMIANNTPLPVSFIFARPNMTYDMGSGILMKGGADTGNTFVGNNDFQLGDDINTKVHHGHYTYYSKAIVKQPNNIMVAHDIFAMGYTGGNDCSIRTNSNPTGSTVVLMVPYNESEKKSNPLSIFHESPCGGSRSEQCKRHTCTSAEFYAGIWEFDPPAGEDAFAFEFEAGASNDLCWQGHQMNWDPTFNRGYTAITRNTGHWGPKVYPGCGQVRAGQMKFFEQT